MSTTDIGLLPEAAARKPQFARSREIQSLQAARGIAALLVVLCHSSAFIGREPGLWQRTAIYLWFRGTALGVQLFFVISGIVIFRAHHQDINQPRKTVIFCWKRFRRIYPLYWICLTLTLSKHFATDHGTSYMHLRRVILSSYLLVHLFSYRTIMVQAWTLFDEVQFYLIFALWIFNRKVGIVIFSLWLAASLFFITPSNYYWSVLLSPYHLLFGFGILVSVALEKNLQVPAIPLFRIGALVFIAAIVIEGPFQRGTPIRLLAGIGAAALLYGAILLEHQGRLCIPSWFKLLGDASYAIYLVHFMAISAIARFAYVHLRQLPIPIGGWMLCFVLCGTGAGLIAHYTIERPLLRLLGKR